MSKFKYRFENIKRIKETFEKEVQRQIKLIDKEISRLYEYIEELESEKDNEKKNIFNKSFVNSKELHFYSNIEKLIDEKIELANQKIAGLKEEKKKKINELLVKSKERRIFEKLEEHHYEEFKLNENKAEQKEVDEFANKKFIKNN